MEEHRVTGHDVKDLMWGTNVKCFMASLRSLKFVVSMEIYKIFLMNRVIGTDQGLFDDPHKSTAVRGEQ